MTKRKSKYPPYQHARQQALELQLNSRQQYIDWHTSSKCQFLPRYPERVYKEWVSWNDWLGTANVFKGDLFDGKTLRPFWDAVKWAQQHAGTHDINTMAQWIVYCKDHGDQIPADVPHRPDQRYTDWAQIGWKGWLGTEVRSKLVAAKQNTALLAICSHHSNRMPGNKYAIIQAENGEAQLINILGQHKDLVVIRVYTMENDLKEQVIALLSRHGRDEGDGWFIPNVNNLLFDLDMVLLQHRMVVPPRKVVVEFTEEMLAPGHNHIVG